MWVGNDDVKTPDGLYLKETVALAGHVLPADPWFEVGDVAVGPENLTPVAITITNRTPEGP